MAEPIEKSVLVRCAQGHAFQVFTGRIDAWWPPSHRRWSDSTLAIEPAVGGRFFERRPSGEEATLGEVLRWEPPSRVTYTWYPGAVAGPTQVDVRFTTEGAATRVDVHHSEGASALGDQWPTRAERFDRAWSEVLPAFQRVADSEEHP